jgi:hypothetical protein
MSIAFTCDYCGGAIDSEGEDNWVTLSAKGGSGWRRHKVDSLGHYHDDVGRPCFDTVRDAIKMVTEYGTHLESIPVASGQAIADQRGRHTRPDGAAVDLPVARSSETEATKRAAAGTKLYQLGRFGGVSNQARRALGAVDVVCLEDAVHWTRKDLLALPDVGKQTVARIDGALRERGLAFRGEQTQAAGARVTEQSCIDERRER